MISPEYSVVIPVFNSEFLLEELFERIRSVFEEMNELYEIIFVEDGGNDNSWEVIRRIKERYPDEVVAVKLARNFGQHNATFCGIVQSKGKFVITIDDDLQQPPEEIRKLITKYEQTEADMVYGIYPDKKHSRYRNLYSASFNQSSKALDYGPGKGSSFRLITRQLVDNIIRHYQSFVFLDELINWYTGDIAFADVNHEETLKKKSGYSGKKLRRLFANVMLYYSNVPLKIMVYGGLLFSTLSFLIGIYYLLKKVFFNVAIMGYTSTIVVITFSTGIIIFSLGVLGEYISRIYFAQSKKPPYTIKKII